jgi:hypothetical protein
MYVAFPLPRRTWTASRLSQPSAAQTANSPASMIAGAESDPGEHGAQVIGIDVTDLRVCLILPSLVEWASDTPQRCE